MSAPAVEVYWLPYCTTCQRAVQHLRARGAEIRRLRDLKAEPLGEEEVRALVEQAGGAEALFSRRAMKYRQMGLHEHQLSPEDLVRLMTGEYTFITRPIVVREGRATAGFSARRIDALLGS